MYVVEVNNMYIVDQDFRPVKEYARIDKRGRLTLGKEAKSQQYRVMVNSCGQILLDPIQNIPERELWLWKNSEALASLEKGVEQAASGELHDLGSFEEYVDLEIDD
jgi:hypothetical protein